MERPLVEGDEVDGKYRVVRHLGAGGMGHVYEADDRSLGRRVALKVLPRQKQTDHVARERLLREGRAAARVRHPGVVCIYEVGSDGETDYVAMELLAGEDLDKRLAREGCLSVPFVEKLGVQLAEAMSAMHDAGIVHRDLKPQNLFLARVGSEHDVLKVLDFGVAKTLTLQMDTLTHTGQVFGTLHYMAPEQLRGAKNADARSDIWSAGAILYEALVGRPPFEADTGPELVLKVATDVPLPVRQFRGDVPARLSAIIARALERDPARRFQSARDLAMALRGNALDTQDAADPQPDAAAHSLVPTVRSREVAEAQTLRADEPPLRRRVPARLTLLLGGVSTSLILGVAIYRGGARQEERLFAPPGMALIAGGTYTVGRTSEELERECKALGAACQPALMAREAPRTEVTLAPFALDRHEVSNEELAHTLAMAAASLHVVEDEDTRTLRYVRWGKGLGPDDAVLLDMHPEYGGIEYLPEQQTFRARAGAEKLPAVQVSWHAARLHCTRLGKRLPREEEWEAAARGQEDRRFPWGNAAVRCGEVAIPRDGRLPMDARCPEHVSPQKVGSSAQDVTPQGVHDLGGNVAEWVDAVYVEGRRAMQAGELPGDLPKVVRGGSWADSLRARTSGRNLHLASSVGANVGFRCAASAQSE